MLVLYNLILMFAALIGLPYLMVMLIQPKRKATFSHRLGWTIHRLVPQPLSCGGQRPIWIHALSVGEVVSAEPIVDRLRSALPNQHVVFSASTQTGVATARRLFERKVQAIFYYPYDFFFSVQRIVQHVTPKLVVIVETDIWPNFLICLKRRDIPVLWVNARVSGSSYRGYRLLGGFSRKLLDVFNAIGAQSDKDATLLNLLGIRPEKITVTGNVKFDQKSSDDPLEEGRRLRLEIGIAREQRVVVFGSTHPGEEAIILGVFLDLKKKFNDLMIITAPRDPGRAKAFAAQLQVKGLTAGFLTSLTGDGVDIHTDALVVNTIGLLRRLYAVADIAYVGGSLVSEGGHNPLEPAACAKPIIFGNDMSDFTAVADLLRKAGAALRVCSAAELKSALTTLLTDETLKSHMGLQALKVFNLNKGAVEKSVNLITQALPIKPPGNH